MKKLATLFLLLLTFQLSFAQGATDVFKSVSTAIAAGNAQGVANFFNTSVEITLPGADQAYAATQGQVVLQDFFKNHAVKSFQPAHTGNSGGTHYQTGTLTTAAGVFDVNVFVKQIGEKYLVTQIRFEEE